MKSALLFRPVLGVLLGALPVVVFAQTDLSRTIVVDASGNSTIKDETTIQAAINSISSSTDRWTVLVYAGTYAEEISLPSNRNIDIVGTDRDGVIIAPTTSTNAAAVVCNGTNSIRNLTVKPTANHGIALNDDTDLANVTVVATGTDKDGLNLASYDRIRITNCKVTAARRALQAVDPIDVLVQSSQFTANGSGGPTIATVRFALATKVTMLDCVITNDGSAMSSSDSNPVTAFFLDGLSGGNVDILLQSCRIVATGAGSGTIVAVKDDLGPGLKLLNCSIVATSTHTSASTPKAIGVDNFATVIGGSITTSAESHKAVDVWDFYSATNAPFVSNTACSKWYNTVKSSEGKKSYLQRILTVPSASSTAIRSAYTLDATETVVTSSIANPTVYRVLTVAGNASGMAQYVYIKGTDWAGNVIVDKITLSGSSVVTGKKPFKTVTSILFPAKTADGQTVSVGTANTLGLYVPVEATTEVIQQAKKASSATSYTIESVATVDAVYGTVAIGPGLTNNDSFEWVVLTGKGSYRKKPGRTLGMALPVGTPAPDFTLRTMGPDGPTDLNLNQYRGNSPLLLLFFPGAFTGVCTAEACSFRDGLDALKQINAKILGVSVDSFFAQAAWAKQNELEFPLASDYEHKVTEAYDVVWPNFAGMGPGAARSVFVIDGHGIIRYAEVTENPGVQVNVEAAIAAIGSLPTTATA